MYSKKTCPFCKRAYGLLTETLSQNVNVIDIQEHPEKREEMISLSGGRVTVPQIFIEGVHVGGCDDLFDLYHAKKLNSLLNIYSNTN